MAESYPYDALMKITNRPDAVFVSGEGSYLTDHTGRRYLDFVQGWAVNCLGHCPPALVEAITRQAKTLINPSPAFYNEPAIRLAALLTKSTGLDRVFFTNSGAEANEGAIKLARKWGSLNKGGAYEILTFDHGFHGRTLATMSASGKEGWDTLFEPKVPGFPKIPLGDLDAVRAAIGPKTVGVMLEPIQGEAGVIGAGFDFLAGLRRLTADAGVLLIVDEIQTGMGRTGTLLACEHAGILPDILTLGKGMGGGVPLAALIASEAVSCFAPGDQGGTFNGNPLICAAGLAVLETLTAPGFLEGVRERSASLRAGLEALAAKHGLGAVRGEGMLLALDTKDRNATDIAARAMASGLLVNAPRPDTLRFMPALTVSEAEIDEMLATLEKAIDGAG